MKSLMDFKHHSVKNRSYVNRDKISKNFLLIYLVASNCKLRDHYVLKCRWILGCHSTLFRSMDSNTCSWGSIIRFVSMFKVVPHKYIISYLNEEKLNFNLSYRKFWTLHLSNFRSLGLNTVSAYQRAKVMTLKIVNFRRSNHNSSPRDASTARNIDMRNGTSAPPIIKKQKGKYSRASPPKNSSNSQDQARLSMEQIEPIRPSNIVTNTHKTRI